MASAKQFGKGVIEIGRFKVKMLKETPGSIKNLKFEYIMLRKQKLAIYKRQDGIKLRLAELVKMRVKYRAAVDLCRERRELLKGYAKDEDGHYIIEEADGRKVTHQAIDEHGNYHTIELTEFVDSDVFHDDEMQRISVETLEPYVVEKLDAMNYEVLELQEEYSLLKPWLYARPAATVIIQRRFRGMVGRRNTPSVRQTFWIAVEYSAAIGLQTWWRKFYWFDVGTTYMVEMRRTAFERKRNRAAPIVQRIWRGYVARVHIHEVRLIRRREAEQAAVVCMQALFRTGLAMTRASAIRKANFEKAEKGQNLLNVVIIQRVFRGWNARLRIRNIRRLAALDPSVRGLADQFIKEGNVFTFLQQISADFKRHREELEREQEMASTFVREVLTKRDEDMAQMRDQWDQARPAPNSIPVKHGHTEGGMAGAAGPGSNSLRVDLGHAVAPFESDGMRTGALGPPTAYAHVQPRKGKRQRKFKSKVGRTGGGGAGEPDWKWLYGASKSYARGNQPVDPSEVTNPAGVRLKNVPGTLGKSNGGAAARKEREVFFVQNAQRSEKELLSSHLLADRPSPRFKLKQPGINGKGEVTHHHHPFKESVLRAAMTQGYTREDVLGVLRGMKSRGQNSDDVSALVFELQRRPALELTSWRKNNNEQEIHRLKGAKSAPAVYDHNGHLKPKPSQKGVRTGSSHIYAHEKREPTSHHFSSSAVLPEAPLGMGSDPSGVVRHSMLRVHCPSTWEGSQPPPGSEECFEAYLKMPPGLPKVRREQEAFRAAQPWVELMEEAGYKSLLALGRGDELLSKLDLIGFDELLAEKMAEVVEELYAQEQRIHSRTLWRKEYADQMDHSHLHDPEEMAKRELMSKRSKLKKERLANGVGAGSDSEGGSGGSDGGDGGDAGGSGYDGGGSPTAGSGGRLDADALRLANDLQEQLQREHGEQQMRQLRPGTADTLPYGPGSRPGTAASFVSGSDSRPGTREGNRTGSRGGSRGGSRQRSRNGRGATPDVLVLNSSRPGTGLSMGGSRPGTGNTPDNLGDGGMHAEDAPLDTVRRLENALDARFEAEASSDSLDGATKNVLEQAAFRVCGSDHFPSWVRLQLEEQRRRDTEENGVAFEEPGDAQLVEAATAAFHKFLRKLSRLPRSHKREARLMVATRRRLATELAAPHNQILEEAGFGNVRELARCPLDDFQVPPALAEAARAIVAKRVAAVYAVNRDSSMEARGMGGRRGKTGIVGMVESTMDRQHAAMEEAMLKPKQALFDARFQRSALDVRGRPPQIGSGMSLRAVPTMEDRMYAREAMANLIADDETFADDNVDVRGSVVPPTPDWVNMKAGSRKSQLFGEPGNAAGRLKGKGKKAKNKKKQQAAAGARRLRELTRQAEEEAVMLSGRSDMPPPLFDMTPQYTPGATLTHPEILKTVAPPGGLLPSEAAAAAAAAEAAGVGRGGAGKPKGARGFIERLQKRTNKIFEEYHNWKDLAQLGRDETPAGQMGEAAPYAAMAAAAGGAPYEPMRQEREQQLMRGAGTGDARRRKENKEFPSKKRQATVGSASVAGAASSVSYGHQSSTATNMVSASVSDVTFASSTMPSQGGGSGAVVGASQLGSLQEGGATIDASQVEVDEHLVTHWPAPDAASATALDRPGVPRLDLTRTKYYVA
jgi:hypothetical protein